MYSIHYFKAFEHYCLYLVTDTDYRIEKVFSHRFTAIIYGRLHGLKVNDN